MFLFTMKQRNLITYSYLQRNYIPTYDEKMLRLTKPNLNHNSTDMASNGIQFGANSVGKVTIETIERHRHIAP